MTDVGPTFNKRSIEDNPAETKSRRKPSGVQKAGTLTRHSSRAEIKRSKSKKTPRTDECECNRDISSLEDFTCGENQRRREVAKSIATDVSLPPTIQEPVNMPCLAETRPIVQDLLLGTNGMVSTDIRAESSTTGFDDSEGYETDISYRTCGPIAEPHVETIGDHYHESDDTQIAKMKLRQQIDSLLSECKEIETKLDKTDDVRDDTKTMQCDVLRSARDSALIQLHIVSSLDDDKEIQMMRQQIQVLNRVVNQSQRLVNERIRSRNVFDMICSRTANLINCNMLLFCSVVAILFYVYQF